jgi:hypothetical protein
LPIYYLFSEALGCGAFLLTEPLDPDDLLLDRKHLAVFGGSNLGELIGRYPTTPRSGSGSPGRGMRRSRATIGLESWIPVSAKISVD